ncbi:MAG: Tol-Pal system beta propeller repeat protein TolB [Gammaproteobacteria bacterium]|nr:Tol-Pal system beta propeller repeat protein TolB [Gammaproteobacteria bacterium]
MRLFYLILFSVIFSTPVFAALTIEITEGVEGAQPIADVPFCWKGQGTPPQDIAQIIDGDLRRSGKFNPLKRTDMLNKPCSRAEIRFQNWRILEIPNLVIGTIEQRGTLYDIEFRLFDVYRAKLLKGLRYQQLSTEQLRKAAHQIADSIYEELTGERGAFDTSIAYIKKLDDNRGFGLFIADSDTEAEQVVLRSPSAILSPMWSPKGRKLAFVKTGKSNPAIYMLDIDKIGDPKIPLEEKQAKRLSPAFEKFSSPAWSPDGKKMAMVKYENGSADIFVMDLGSNDLERITDHWSIDTEPTWSPDGQSLIFTSERGGSPQLYQYFFSSKKIKRLTFEGAQNLRAAFSPDGRMITFVHLSDNKDYNIATLELDGGIMRIVSRKADGESEHESPSFAPNGSMIIYAANYHKGKMAKKTALSAVSVDGGFHQRYINKTGSGEVREPAWSSF